MEKVFNIVATLTYTHLQAFSRFYSYSLNDLSVEETDIEFLAASAEINFNNSLADYIEEENWPYKSSNLNAPCLHNMGVTKNGRVITILG